MMSCSNLPGFVHLRLFSISWSPYLCRFWGVSSPLEYVTPAFSNIPWVFSVLPILGQSEIIGRLYPCNADPHKRVHIFTLMNT
uniref:Uncharacterized protein n=1 Tax=Aegilops tauschii subsp. strangulata TaxID=200361 RepID=A0A453J394_AEGTS